MKRKLALILVLVALFTMVLPMQAFAAGLEEPLQNAITIAKTKFEIPADYKFESSISSENGKNVFYLYWRSTDTVDQSNISVTIDEDGTIMNYYTYSPNDYSQTIKLPAISKQEAELKAEEFIKNIDPKLWSQLKAQPQVQSNSLDSFYYTNYYRVVNGLPFYANSVSVSINKQSGKLQSFNRNWTSGVEFPAVAPISTTNAKTAYKNNLGLKLAYKYNYDYSTGKITIFPAYIPVFDNNNYVLDAATGSKLQLYSNYYYGDKGGSSPEMASSKDSASVPLNPDELKAIADAAELITLDEAKAIASKTAFLNLTADFSLESYNLYTSWPMKTDYVWNLYYVKPDETNMYAYNVSVGIDAKTGTITNFYSYTSNTNETKPIYGIEDAKAAAEKFLQTNYASLYSQLKYDQAYTENILAPYGTEKPQSYSIKFNRLVNGIEFPDNGFYVEYNAVTGAITSMNMTWFKTEFPSIDNIITLDEAYTTLFTEIGLGLEYRLKSANYYQMYSSVMPAQSPEVYMVYALGSTKPHIIGAYTGEVLIYDGSVYEEYKPVSYTDIEGSYAEEKIKVLAENGIYLSGTEFKPTASITQQDFLWLLAKAMGYYGEPITYKTEPIVVESMYSYLIREGVVTKAEVAPAAAVIREDAAKYVVRSMKLGKVAELPGIFKENTFTDRASISEALQGYVKIASAMKLVNGYEGKFYPKQEMNRAAAIVLIYNYLSVR